MYEKTWREYVCGWFYSYGNRLKEVLAQRMPLVRAGRNFDGRSAWTSIFFALSGFLKTTTSPHHTQRTREVRDKNYNANYIISAFALILEFPDSGDSGWVTSSAPLKVLTVPHSTSATGQAWADTSCPSSACSGHLPWHLCFIWFSTSLLLVNKHFTSHWKETMRCRIGSLSENSKSKLYRSNFTPTKTYIQTTQSLSSYNGNKNTLLSCCFLIH